MTCLWCLKGWLVLLWLLLFWGLELLLLEPVKTSSGGCSNEGVICGSRNEMVVETLLYLLLSNESRNFRKRGIGIDAKATSASASASNGVGGVEVY